MNGKSGSQFIYYNANGTTQANLFSLGYKYYTKQSLSYWGSNMILKVVDTEYSNNTLYCLCVNTIGFSFYIKATEVILNTN